MTRTVDLPAISDVSLTPEELASLNQLSGQDWCQQFFGLWTFKEAHIKAQGKGLSIPLQEITIRLSRQSISIQFCALAQQERSQDWRFALSNPTSRHCLALAVCMRSLDLRTTWAIPSVGCQHATISYVDNC
jgi:4'-phosphopantetheinyl transferase